SRRLGTPPPVVRENGIPASSVAADIRAPRVGAGVCRPEPRAAQVVGEFAAATQQRECLSACETPRARVGRMRRMAARSRTAAGIRPSRTLGLHAKLTVVSLQAACQTAPRAAVTRAARDDLPRGLDEERRGRDSNPR